MVRYKHIDTSPRFIAVDLQRQLLPGKATASIRATDNIEKLAHHGYGQQKLFRSRRRSGHEKSALAIRRAGKSSDEMKKWRDILAPFFCASRRGERGFSTDSTSKITGATRLYRVAPGYPPGWTPLAAWEAWGQVRS